MTTIPHKSKDDDEANPLKSKGRTLNVVPNPGEMIKPVELIDINGATGLSLHARRLYNQLIAHAFGPGLGEEGTEWTIALSELRGTHRSNEKVSASVVALMKTVVSVRLPDGKTRRVALLGANDMDADGRDRGKFTYSFDPKLVPLLRESSVFGKIELAVMHAFTTKYALALYEALSRRVRLNSIHSDTLEVDAFREMLGVPEGKLKTYSNLRLKAIEPAVEEINALAGFGCKIEPVKVGQKVTALRVFWWLKDIEEQKAAYAELNRCKVGRKARTSGLADEVVEDSAPTLFE